MMRMDGAGLIHNGVFAKALRMLADPYKCLKNVTIDCPRGTKVVLASLQVLVNLLYTAYRK